MFRTFTVAEALLLTSAAVVGTANAKTKPTISEVSIYVSGLSDYATHISGEGSCGALWALALWDLRWLTELRSVVGLFGDGGEPRRVEFSSQAVEPLEAHDQGPPAVGVDAVGVAGES